MTINRSVYLSPDKRISVRSRRLVEVSLPEKLEEHIHSDVLAYLGTRYGNQDNSVYPNSDIDYLYDDPEYEPTLKIEAFFWIPSSEEILKEVYEEVPAPIMDALMAAFKDFQESDTEDSGFALIGFF